MFICPKCNRDSGCLHHNPLSQKEMYIVFGSVFFIAQLFMAMLTVQDGVIEVYKTLLYGTYSLIFILILMNVAYFMYDKQYLAVFFGCHQKKERSFQKNGIPYILCARCTGIMIGIVLSYFAFKYEVPLILLGILTIPLFVDGIIQHFTEYESKNLTRLITGILFAPALVIIFTSN